jgi:hypothetical protein
VNEAQELSSEIARGARRAVREVKPWVERAARIGHAAKGTVYVLTGIVTLAAGLGLRREPDGPEGAVAMLGGLEPFGPVVMVLIAVGLLYYALWELYRALADPEHEARGRVFLRAGWLITAVVFGSLAVAAFQLALGRSIAGDDETARGWAWTLLSKFPYGVWALGLTGAGIFVAGVSLVKRGWTTDLERRIDMSDLPPRTWHAPYVLARFGMIARGVVISLIGAFLLLAAWTHDPREAVGFSGALRALAHHAFGPSMVAALALGLVSYGIYELLVSWKGRFSVR